MFPVFNRQGDVINLGNRQLTVLHMPGHSRGSICLHDRENKLLFTGDVVYDGHMIDWLPYSHVSDYIGSCERLVGLVDSEQVLVTQQGASEHLRPLSWANSLCTMKFGMLQLSELSESFFLI